MGSSPEFRDAERLPHPGVVCVKVKKMGLATCDAGAPGAEPVLGPALRATPGGVLSSPLHTIFLDLL
jgi:hypothetical protein